MNTLSTYTSANYSYQDITNHSLRVSLQDLSTFLYWYLLRGHQQSNIVNEIFQLFNDLFVFHNYNYDLKISLLIFKISLISTKDFTCKLLLFR